jgi:isocitrate dehydrogenase
LWHRGKIDGNEALQNFSQTLEQTCVDTVESGEMTRDMALLIGEGQTWLNTQNFIGAIARNFEKRVG